MDGQFLPQRVPGNGDGAMTGQPERGNLLRYATAGIQFSAVFAFFAMGGMLLDFRLNTMPGYTLLGMAVGFGLGLYRLLRQAKELRRIEQNRDEESKDRR